MTPSGSASDTALAPALVERVLERLGFARPPSPDRAGLGALYAAWCRRVPFDNTRKLIALRSSQPGRLPGDDPTDLLGRWLEVGAGGTCWAMHGAWTELLSACGFRGRRGLATMLVAPDLSPNHGTASVELDDDRLLVDVCMQHGEPLALEANRASGIPHPAWGVQARFEGDRYVVHWPSPFQAGGMDCRIDSLECDAAEFRERHEQTRGWSPFNFGLFARIHRDGGLVLAVRGERVFVDASGRETRSPLAGDARLRFLIEELGLDEAFARRVPEDVPMPPPPGSRSAQGIDAG